MITPLLRTVLEPVAQQHRRLRLLNQWTLWWVIIALVGVARLATGSHSALWLMLLACAAATGAIWIWRRSRAWQPDWQEIARRVEERHPELHALLLTAVEQSPDPRTRELNYLQQRVIAETVILSRQQGWLDSIPRSRWMGAGAFQVVALAAMLTVFSTFDAPHITRAGRMAAQQPPASRDGVEITPGDVELERGSGLVVMATFSRNVPSEATLVVQPRNQPAQRAPLTKNLNDPAFGGGLPEVDSDLTYRVEYAGRATRDFKVKVFEHPRLDRADATLHYPDYTKLPEKKMPNARRVSAVEGTKLEVAFQLNKPVKSATLITKDGKQTPLAIEPGKAAASLRDFEVKTSQTYELRLVDADGRTSKTPAQFAVEALPNRRPELKFITPKGDQRLSPIEEVAFRAEAWDDFGLVRYGLTMNVAGKGEKEMELGRDTRADERRELAQMLKLEETGVKQDELVSWHLWAEDIGPDSKPRRTATDMFFGEIRPFEEIFRPGDGSEAEQQQQQQQQQQQNSGNQATKLADLQKQIINATWKLKRGEDAQPKSPSEQYLKDVPAVRDGQNEALQMASALNERAEEPKTRALVENVTREMQTALDRLNKAEKTPAPLPDALASEQAAYNALLKLAAHEFRVVRQQRNQQQQQQAGNNQERQQQQLDQLELKDEKKRYETKRQAEAPQNEQQRAQLTVLNRLKELAQRQQDINERLKELQTALQSAKTEQEKEEARRQLKRLREEEQQMLADMDETRQKMEQSPQQGQLADERRQLDDTRNEAQKAVESMERNAASQALASGARAARQLEQMRDDFRKKTSGQFNDEMRQMRTDARELAQNQQRIADQLQAEPSKPERKTLDGSGEREQLSQQFKKQKDQLAGITEQMKQVSEQAETAEPLLSKELYDTLRKTAQADTDQKLQHAQMLAGRGYPTEARQFEQKARAEIEDLKTGVERAAESVLGNEAEALRQAQAELDALNEQLNREIAQARPDLANAGQGQLAENRANQRGPQEENPQKGEPQNAGSQGQNPGDGENEQNRLAQAQPSRRMGQSSEQQAQSGQPNQSPNSPGRQSARSQNARQNQQQDGGGQRSAIDPSQAGQPSGGNDPRLAAGQSQQKLSGAPQIAQNNSRREGAGPQRNGQRSSQLGQQDQQGQQTAQNGPREGTNPPDGQQQSGRQGQTQNRQRQPGQQTAQNASQGRGQPSGQEQSQDSSSENDAQQGSNAGGTQGSQESAQTAQASGERSGNPAVRQNSNRNGGANNGADPASSNEGQQQQQRQARLTQMLGQPRQRGVRNGGSSVNSGAASGQQGGEGERDHLPLTGEDFVQWSDRLRNVEEMLDAPDLRNEAGRIRELAKGVRVEFKRHSIPPNWDMVKTQIGAPLAELRNRLAEELARQESKENLVPIDRDPVPTKYAEGVRRYYEELGLSR